MHKAIHLLAQQTLEVLTAFGQNSLRLFCFLYILQFKEALQELPQV